MTNILAEMVGIKSLIILLFLEQALSYSEDQFPASFMFGAATASYQIEGAWNISGKGENIWDRFTHVHNNWIADESNGDIACDSYHLYREDVKALKEMQFDFYRFSISWSRILPNGTVNYINKEGIDYYNNLILELLANGIQPLVTMYHWDLPQPLQDLGGWPNLKMAEYFEDYARILFTHFGDRVKWWITFNEPGDICSGYVNGAEAAPGLSAHGVADYLTIYTLLTAHAKVYHLYNKHFRKQQAGKIGFNINSRWMEPLTNSSEDKLAAARAMQFEAGIFTHPIFSKSGDFPSIVRQNVDRNSMAEGLFRSRLPIISTEMKDYIRGSADYFALNHYTTRLVTSGVKGRVPSIERDSEVVLSVDSRWPSSASSWLQVVPWGMRKVLKWIKDEYNNPPVLITENGYSDHGELQDEQRINYYKSYLKELLNAMHIDKSNVIGFTAWSIIDNFEWARGYTEKFGLYHVNFSDPSRKRTPKASSYMLRKVIQTRKVPDEDYNTNNEQPRVVLIT